MHEPLGSEIADNGVPHSTYGPNRQAPFEQPGPRTRWRLLFRRNPPHCTRGLVVVLLGGFWEIRDGIYQTSADALNCAEAHASSPHLATQRAIVRMVADVVSKAPSALPSKDRAAIMRNMARLGVRWIGPLRWAVTKRGEFVRGLAPMGATLLALHIGDHTEA